MVAQALAATDAAYKAAPAHSSDAKKKDLAHDDFKKIMKEFEPITAALHPYVAQWARGKAHLGVLVGQAGGDGREEQRQGRAREQRARQAVRRAQHQWQLGYAAVGVALALVMRRTPRRRSRSARSSASSARARAPERASGS